MKKEFFKALGQKVRADFDQPDKKLLETFENRHVKNIYLIPIFCEEFSCICPVTGQPDFAMIEIVYSPARKCLESKSLKLYLTSYRNYGIFHESVSNRIFDDLWELLEPKYLQVKGNFRPRGGISITPVMQKFDAKLGDSKKTQIMDLISVI